MKENEKPKKSKDTELWLFLSKKKRIVTFPTKDYHWLGRVHNHNFKFIYENFDQLIPKYGGPEIYTWESDTQPKTVVFCSKRHARFCLER